MCIRDRLVLGELVLGDIDDVAGNEGDLEQFTRVGTRAEDVRAGGNHGVGGGYDGGA